MKRFLPALFSLLLPTTAQSSPNVLFVIADDMGVDVSPCYAKGRNVPDMPVLESLCRAGMVFENAWTAPTCTPTRAMVMTGLYPSQSGVGAATSRQNPVGVNGNTTSLFDRLPDSHAKAVIGKWHISEDNRNYDHPKQLGVPYYRGVFSGGVKAYDDWAGVVDGQRRNFNTYVTTQFTDWAIDWIDDQNENPWFLWLAYTAPHTPFHKPPTGLHDRDGLSDSDQAIRRRPQDYYFAALEALDSELGRLLASLGAQERARTTVVFLGDNGTPGQVVRRLGLKFGAKGSLYPGGVHVPLVVSGPGVRNGRSDALVTATDLYSTLVSLAGGDAAAAPSASVNFANVLKGAKGRRSAAYSESFGKGEVRGRGFHGWSITDGQHVLVQRQGGGQELFKSGSTRDLLKGGTSSARKTADHLTALRNQLLSQP